MTSLFPAHRAAEEFDSVLEGRATTAVAERYSALAATAQVLRGHTEVLPRAAFVVDLRERLMLAAETEMVPAAPVVRRLPSKSHRNRRLGTIAASLVIVGGTAGMAAAASGSLPGQALYPVKRGVEQVRIATHFGEASKGTALLDQAGTRLDEVQGLLQSGADQSLVDSTVANFQSSANAGADKLFKAYQTDDQASDVTSVRDFTASAMDQVAAMASGSNPSTVSALRDTADTLATIDQQATTLCTTCGSATTLTPPAPLAAGSGAPTVSNLIARPVTQARKDIATQTAITDAQLDGLKDRAQGAADKMAKSSKSGDTKALKAPLTGTVTSSGKLVPSLVSSTAGTVTNLVGGLTGTVTGGASSGSDDSKAAGNPVGKALKGTGDTAGKTLDGLKGLTNGLTPKN
jgi:hypothetical protein